MADLSLTEPQKAVVINRIDGSFYEAITFISNQKVISLLVNGPKKIDRFGAVYLMTVGTRQMVYLFDISVMGDDAVNKGLQSVIENPNILKVCHDVRMLSDFLQAKYEIQPVNIFDTQVADAFIHKNENGKFPETVSTLADCTERHLGKTVQKHSLDFKNKDTQKKIAMKAMYLRELKPIMMEKLLADYLHGVDIYLNVVRKQADHAVKYVNVNKLPGEFFKEFQKNGIAGGGAEPRGKFQTGRRKNNFNNRPRYDDTEEEDGGMWGAPSAGRSVWDNGETFSNQYHEKHGEIIESMGMGTVMIDEDKPLLRKPKSNNPNLSSENSHKKARNQDTNDQDISNNSQLESTTYDKRSTVVDRVAAPQSIGMDDRTTTEQQSPLSDSKSHIRQFQVRENQFSDYQFSGTSDSDDNFLVTSSNNKGDNGYDLDEIEELMKLEMKRANNKDKMIYKSNKKPNTLAISDAGKRMIMNGLGRKKQEKQQRHQSNQQSYYSSSPASSVDTNEFPTLQESQRQASLKLSPGKSKQLISSGNSSPFYSGGDNNSPNGQTVKAMGRGQILKRLTEQSSTTSSSPHVRRLSPALCDISAPRSIAGVNSAYDFPSDEELLDTPHVVPAVVGAPVVGKNVNVLKRFNK